MEGKHIPKSIYTACDISCIKTLPFRDQIELQGNFRWLKQKLNLTESKEP